MFGLSIFRNGLWIHCIFENFRCQPNLKRWALFYIDVLWKQGTYQIIWTHTSFVNLGISNIEHFWKLRVSFFLKGRLFCIWIRNFLTNLTSPTSSGGPMKSSLSSSTLKTKDVFQKLPFGPHTSKRWYIRRSRTPHPLTSVYPILSFPLSQWSSRRSPVFQSFSFFIFSLSLSLYIYIYLII